MVRESPNRWLVEPAAAGSTITIRNASLVGIQSIGNSTPHFSARAKWRSLKTARGKCVAKNLDITDVVIDGLSSFVPQGGLARGSSNAGCKHDGLRHFRSAHESARNSRKAGPSTRAAQWIVIGA